MYNDNIIYLSRLFLVFSSSRAFLSQNNVHAPLFKILIFSTAAARAFGSSQMRQQTSLMFFFSGWYAYLTQCDVDTQLEMIQYSVSLYSQDGLLDYCTLLLICSKMWLMGVGTYNYTFNFYTFKKYTFKSVIF